MADKIVKIDGVGSVAFPDSMADEDIAKVIQKQYPTPPSDEAKFSPAFQKAGLVEPPSAVDYIRHYLGRFVPGALSAVGGGLGAEAGGAGAIPGAALGSLAGQQLQASFPTVFGAGPKTGGDTLAQTGEDILGNAIIPGAANKILSLGSPAVAALSSRLLRNTGPVRNAVAEDTIGQATGKLNKILYPQSSVVETAGENVRNNAANAGSPPADSIGGTLAKIPYTQTGLSETPINAAAKRALSDVTQVRNFKLQAGEPYTIEQVATKDLLGKGYSPSSGAIDPDKILSALDGEKQDVYNEAIRPQTRDNITTLLNTIKEAQASQKDGTGVNGVINYAKHRVIFALPAMAMGAMGGHEAIGTLAGGASIVLTDVAINKLMSNPVTAKAVVQAIKTPASNQATSLLSKVIMNGLRGTSVLLTAPDEDKPMKAFVDDQGQLQYQKPQGQ